MPAFNEEAQIEASVEAIVAHLVASGETWELVVIDDGSRDATASRVEAIAARDGRVHLVRHGRNQGVGQAIATGFQASRGDWFMVIPADLAMDLRDIDRFLGARHGVAVVAGYTSSRADYSAWRGLVSWANRHAVALLAGVRVRNPNYIHLFRHDALRGDPFRFTGSAALYAEMLRRAQARGPVVEVPIRYVPRVSGVQTGARWSLVARTARDLLRVRLGLP